MGKQSSFAQAVKYAIAGIRFGFQLERNMRRDFWLAHVILGVEIVIRPPLSAVVATIMAVSLVMSAELFNTAIERAVDQITNGKWSYQAKIAKDTAAGAVLLTAMGSIGIGIWAVICARPWHVYVFSFQNFDGLILALGYLCTLWYFHGATFKEIDVLTDKEENQK